MTDLVVTAANVLASGQATKETGVAGAAVTAGQPIYKEAATGLFKLADCDSATAEAKSVYGVALHAASTNQPLTVVKDDPDFTPGGTLTAGARYYLSGTAGGIAPEADLASGDNVVLLFIAKSTSKGILKIFNSGVAVP